MSSPSTSSRMQWDLPAATAGEGLNDDELSTQSGKYGAKLADAPALDSDGDVDDEEGDDELDAELEAEIARELGED